VSIIAWWHEVDVSDSGSLADKRIKWKANPKECHVTRHAQGTHLSIETLEGQTSIMMAVHLWTRRGKWIGKPRAFMVLLFGEVALGVTAAVPAFFPAPAAVAFPSDLLLLSRVDDDDDDSPSARDCAPLATEELLLFLAPLVGESFPSDCLDFGVVFASPPLGSLAAAGTVAVVNMGGFAWSASVNDVSYG
jgi:hypothetical protein